MSVAPELGVVADKDGYYSIEFVNTGMSGVREITNEFSRHGELVKVKYLFLSVYLGIKIVFELYSGDTI